MEIESVLPQGSTSLWVCKEAFSVLLLKVFNLHGFILYWYDISSDILLAIRFKENCHSIYFKASICIMCCSFYFSMFASAGIYISSLMVALLYFDTNFWNEVQQKSYEFFFLLNYTLQSMKVKQCYQWLHVRVQKKSRSFMVVFSLHGHGMIQKEWVSAWWSAFVMDYFFPFT